MKKCWILSIIIMISISTQAELTFPANEDDYTCDLIKSVYAAMDGKGGNFYGDEDFRDELGYTKKSILTFSAEGKAVLYFENNDPSLLAFEEVIAANVTPAQAKEMFNTTFNLLKQCVGESFKVQTTGTTLSASDGNLMELKMYEDEEGGKGLYYVRLSFGY